MANFSKRFKIIEKIKSFVVREKNYDKAKESDDITKEIANKIQISSYNLSKSHIKDNIFTPTYKNIAEQLSVNDDVIFKSCVYHLVKIAKRQKKYRADIVKILSAKQSEYKKSDEKYSYLAHQINEI